MAEHSRYSVTDDQAGFQEGILKNKFNIKDQQTLDDVETILLHDTYKHFFDLLSAGKLKFNLQLVFKIHEYFLGTLYSWAGKIRTVDISKDGILFVPAKFIPASLASFENELRSILPLAGSKKEIVRRIALVHCELNTIHPFREGNGRTLRLFLDLLVVQAGYQPIDWSKASHKKYIAACLKGMMKEYAAMEKIINSGLRKSR